MANMKKLFIAVMVIGLTFAAVTTFAQSAKEAVLALKKLEARCQAGLSRSEYYSALGDAKFPVNLYMESSDAKQYSELTESINKVMQFYEKNKEYIDATRDPPAKIYCDMASKELQHTTKLYAKIEGNKSGDIDKLKEENEKLKKDAEIEKLKAENEKLKKQLESMKSKVKK